MTVQFPDKIWGFLGFLGLTIFMITLELAGNTTRMNVASLIVNILLKRQLMQSLLIINLTMMKMKRFQHGETHY